ncbi:MAG: hypothetical protein NT066_06925 [Candidatus Omnitrophica bacterium]|nr:hypothetical protein [Candidatus Omnitrophota bacterium]
MKIEKEKRKVCIIFEGGVLVEGLVHLNQGERVSDFLNNSRENFIAITDVQFYGAKEVESFKLFVKISKKKKAVILNKSLIQLIEEV